MGPIISQSERKQTHIGCWGVCRCCSFPQLPIDVHKEPYLFHGYFFGRQEAMLCVSLCFNIHWLTAVLFLVFIVETTVYFGHFSHMHDIFYFVLISFFCVFGFISHWQTITAPVPHCKLVIWTKFWSCHPSISCHPESTLYFFFLMKNDSLVVLNHINFIQNKSKWTFEDVCFRF